jgi:putative MATE family efflux protein
MLALALPVLAEESLNLLVGYTDFFLAGRFLPGDEPLAAMSFVAYLLWVVPSLFSFVGIGALALVARLVGGGQRHDAAHATRQALMLGLALAAIGTVAAIVLGQSFARAMGLQGEAARLATRYIWIISPAIPLIMVEQVGTACLRGAGDTFSGMAARVVVNLVDMALSASLVIGWGWLPDLGWDGLAIGSACGHAIGGLIILARLVQGRGGVSLRDREGQRPSWRPDWPTMQRMLRVGIPGGLDVVAVIACHLVYVAIINRLGTLSQAAHGLGVQIEAMSYLPGSAFQVAAATLAGQALGAGNPRRAVWGALLCAGYALAIMTTAGLVLFFGGETIASFFTGDKTDLAALVGHLLKIVALSCPPLALLMIMSGTLRGSGDTRWPLVITFIGLVGIRIPGAWLLAWDEVPLPLSEWVIPGLGWGVAGAWWAMVADVCVRSILLVARFAQGGWQRVKV